MENKEDVLNALEDFIKKPSETIPEILESYLKHIAKTGTTVFPWGKLKPLFEQRLSQAISEFHERFPMDKSNVVSANVESLSFDVMRDRILEAIKTFSGAPFTIQRLCELITTPGKHYRSTAKYLRGIEKNIMVVSTVDPFGRKIVCESSPLVNGIADCTPAKPSTFTRHLESPDRTNHSPFVPPAPSNSPDVVSSNWVTENGAQKNEKSDVATTLWDSNKEEQDEEEEMSQGAAPLAAETPAATSSAATSSAAVTDSAADDIETRRSSGGFETSSYQSADATEPSAKKPRLEETSDNNSEETTTTADEEEEVNREQSEAAKEAAKEEVAPPVAESQNNDSTNETPQSADSLNSEKSMETD